MLVYIEGPQGCGKSTLAQVICQAYKTVTCWHVSGVFGYQQFIGAEAVIFEGKPSDSVLKKVNAPEIEVCRPGQEPIMIAGPEMVVVILQRPTKTDPQYLKFKLEKHVV